MYESLRDPGTEKHESLQKWQVVIYKGVWHAFAMFLDCAPASRGSTNITLVVENRRTVQTKRKKIIFSSYNYGKK